MFANLARTSLLDPLEWIKWVFVVAYVLSTIGVTVGVYWEGDQFEKTKQQRGWRLLILSLAADTLFTILIFATDGWISHIQRQEIIALEKRLAARAHYRTYKLGTFNRNYRIFLVRFFKSFRTGKIGNRLP
jgi:hypothetical protein